MTSVRERNRGGLRSVFSDSAPSAEEARFDRIEIGVSAEIIGSRQAISEYINFLNDESDAFVRGDVRDKFLNQFGNQGYKRQTQVREGRWTIGGDAAVTLTARGARLDLRLKLNTTRTAQHALSVAGYEDLAALPVFEFFRLRPEVVRQTRSQTLTRSDNALLGTNRLGGNEAAFRFERNQQFLRTYEAKLIELIQETFMPSELGFPLGERSGHGTLPSGSIGVSFAWAQLRVTQAEIYWERAHSSAFSFARQLAGRLMDAAPSAKLRRYFPNEPERVERQGDSLLVTVPQRKNLDLVVYAKTLDRVRFEMRYQQNLSNILRRRPTTSSESPLMPWLERLAEHASLAVPWDGVREMMPTSPSTDPLELFSTFADNVRLACEQVGRISEFARIMSYLLEGRGISEGGEFDPDGRLIRALAAHQVLIQVPLRRRSRGIPRRWTIDPLYSPMLDSLAAR